MTTNPLARLRMPSRLYLREDVLSRPSPVPATPGIYGWYFRQPPHPTMDFAGCESFDGLLLLYVGIAPKAPPATGNSSRQSLRSRIRYHYTGNAEGSTLRLTLGCLLSERLQIRLCRVGSGKRLTFTPTGERVLSAWMGENAFVTWVETADPWFWEEQAMATLDLPLNLGGNRRHPFHPTLTAARAAAKADARARDIVI